jgi:hypothetical protein
MRAPKSDFLRTVGESLDVGPGGPKAQILPAMLPILALVSEIRMKNRLARTLLETYVGSHAGELILAGATGRGKG